MFAHCLLPPGPPPRRIWRYPHLADRPAAGSIRHDQRATDESVLRVIKMIGVELVDRSLSGRPSADEWVYLNIFIEECGTGGAHLISVILADYTLAALGIVRRSDARQQQQAHIVHLKCR